MSNYETNISTNIVHRKIDKQPKDYTRKDIVKFVLENHINMINFMYPAEDGRLKTLNFVINSIEYLEMILSSGERVDGSSLFPSYVEPGNSDLYVIPRYSTAFMEPFADEPTLCFLCSFFDKSGNPFNGSPIDTLKRAAKEFTKQTGMVFEAMGELEYYVMAEDNHLFPATDQRGYHESGPYSKFNNFRQSCMSYIAAIGGQIKYGHSEVGNFSQDNKLYEQNEIEFLPCPAEDAADQLTLAKWVICNLAYKNNLEVTFAPKITVGKAGSGFHIHMRIMKDGKNMLLEKGELSDYAKKAIGGMMMLASSITAFGNRNPTSYMRLVPHQEAPTNICWGDRNRSVLVRVPLGWTSDVDMGFLVNGENKPSYMDFSQKQTFEMRSPDGSADIYLLLAGLCVACRYGLEHFDSLEKAKNTYVDGDIHSEENKVKLENLEHLPVCCVESANCLEKQREIYEAYNVFSSQMIDGIIKKLKDFDDENINEIMKDNKELLKMVKKYFYV